VDGHGSDGHLVAAWLCERLPKLLERAGAAEDAAKAIKEAFVEAERDLESPAGQESFNAEFSGAAAVALVLRPEEKVAYLASCGDCQAVVLDMATGSFDVNKPHKAHDILEGERIEAADGYVEIIRDREDLFSRVYPPSMNFGLAMSRSFGDLCLKPHGVVAEPEVAVLSVPWPGACCVLGSDGLFDFLEPAELAGRLRRDLPGMGAQALAEVLVDEAQRRWREAHGDYVDDISCLILLGRGLC